MKSRYWIVVFETLEHDKVLFQVRDDGVVEYGSEYTPEKAKQLFQKNV